MVPSINAELEALVVRLARENHSWGYSGIVGALANVGYGYMVSNQTVGNILKRHGISPVPKHEKKTTWREFIRMQMDVLVATNFSTTAVWTWCGLITLSVLFLIHLGSRKVHVTRMTPHPHEARMMRMARNLTMAEWGA